MIRTKRVLLRPLKDSDKLIQYKYEQDLRICTLQASKPRVTTEICIDKWYQRATERDPHLSVFAIEVEKCYIGYCTIQNTESDTSTYMYGIVIGNHEYWGNGYGTEVTLAIIDYVFVYLGGRRIGLVTNSKNVRAIECFKKSGFIVEGRLRKARWVKGGYADSIYMGILKEEWKPVEKEDPAYTDLE
ncbi:hypothetical protein CSA37_05695 [Candidatus Fermentibacteria bacterium]|nr:MAG: hypothetical protein CSA37_05695 [Candidatus Fermentibacteria bacterium]